MGGAQVRFTTIANHFGARWRHAIVSMDGETGARERLASELNADFPRPEIRKGDLLANLRQFRKVLTSLRPAVMLTHNFGSIEWAIANYYPVVPHVHVEDGFGPDEKNSQIPRRVLLRRVFLRRRPVILPSLTLMTVARESWKLRFDDLHHVPNGVDLSRFKASFVRQSWPGNGPVVGTVAALRPEKNIARLIQAFNLVNARRQARLVIVGDGPQRDELEALAAELGLRDRIFFEGQIANPAPFIQSFDVFAMSSDTEQMPISLLEAMAAGRPTVATDVGDTRWMLPNISGAFLTPRDHNALAKALLDIIENPVLQDELGQANRVKASQNFSQANMFDKWSALLDPNTACPSRKSL